MPRRVLVVVNPISGRGRALRAAERFAAAFEAKVSSIDAEGESDDAFEIPAFIRRRIK